MIVEFSILTINCEKFQGRRATSPAPLCMNPRRNDRLSVDWMKRPFQLVGDFARLSHQETWPHNLSSSHQPIFSTSRSIRSRNLCYMTDATSLVFGRIERTWRAKNLRWLHSSVLKVIDSSSTARLRSYRTRSSPCWMEGSWRLTWERSPPFSIAPVASSRAYPTGYIPRNLDRDSWEGIQFLAQFSVFPPSFTIRLSNIFTSS